MLSRIMSRRTAILSCASAIAVSAHAAEPPRDVTYIDDFDELHATLGARYCFFHGKATDWQKVQSIYRPQAAAAESDDIFIDIIRRVLAELYDPHTHLSNPPNGSPRWPLFDILAEPVNGFARIVAIDADSAAADAGLKIGDQITKIDGSATAAVIKSLMPQCLLAPDSSADAYTTNVAVAGRRGRARTLEIRSDKTGSFRNVFLSNTPRPNQSDVSFRALNNNIGCIVIRSFANAAAVADFDQALSSMRNAAGIIIDMRDNGGGDTAVARPMMGRFIAERRLYALMRRRDGAGLGEAWQEFVEPRGPFTYIGPVVVLTSHWSASMAEGFPMGMRDIGRARIVGTKMMGLGAAVYPITLDRTGISAQYSAEIVYDNAGRPRAQLRPDVELPNDADILQAGLHEIQKMIASHY